MSNKKTKRRALVTGGGSGIGESICERLAREGCEVIIIDLDLHSAQSTADKIIAAGGAALAYACDISSQSQVKEVFDTIQQSSALDILINNAGIAHVGTIEQTSEKDLDRIYNVNVKGLYNASLAVIPAMRKQKHGVIINMGSVASSVGIVDRFAYSMSKGAVLAMTYSIAKDYVNDGIRCNCVAPGRVHTPFVDNFLQKNYPDNCDEMFNKLSKTQPIGRMGTANEIASIIAYLCSDDAAFITGSNFPIDGGFVTLNN